MQSTAVERFNLLAAATQNTTADRINKIYHETRALPDGDHRGRRIRLHYHNSIGCHLGENRWRIIIRLMDVLYSLPNLCRSKQHIKTKKELQGDILTTLFLKWRVYI
jgi:hypothetical protein